MVGELSTTWGSLRPTFRRTLLALLKKNILVKIRYPAAIIEFLVGAVIWMLMEPVVRLARDTFSPTGTDPPLRYTPLIPEDLIYVLCDHGASDTGRTSEKREHA
jgi:hypothetical protein